MLLLTVNNNNSNSSSCSSSSNNNKNWPWMGTDSHHLWDENMQQYCGQGKEVRSAMCICIVPFQPTLKASHVKMGTWIEKRLQWAQEVYERANFVILTWNITGPKCWNGFEFWQAQPTSNITFYHKAISSKVCFNIIPKVINQRQLRNLNNTVKQVNLFL